MNTHGIIPFQARETGVSFPMLFHGQCWAAAEQNGQTLYADRAKCLQVIIMCVKVSHLQPESHEAQSRTRSMWL